jgi:hypothetical protein
MFTILHLSGVKKHILPQKLPKLNLAAKIFNRLLLREGRKCFRTYAHHTESSRRLFFILYIFILVKTDSVLFFVGLKV